MAMLKRLMDGESYTSKFAAIALFPSVYTSFSSARQQEIMAMFNKIS